MQSTVMRLYVVCPSVCPSVTLTYVFYTGWNTSKIILWLNSLRLLLLRTPTWVIWCNGNTLKYSEVLILAAEWNRCLVLIITTPCSVIMV